MSHKYQEYTTRVLDIDKNQKKIKGWLYARDSVFVHTAIFRQFDSIEKLEKCINYYIRKNAEKLERLVIIEDILLFHISYSKFFSADSITKLFKDEEAAKKYMDGLFRLSKKGYIKRTLFSVLLVF